MNRYEKAIVAYDAFLKMRSRHYEAFDRKGDALLQLGRYREAINIYNAALKIEPHRKETIYARGVTLRRLRSLK